MQPEARDPVCITDMLNAARGVVRSLQGVSLAKYQSDQDLRHAVERKPLSKNNWTGEIPERHKEP